MTDVVTERITLDVSQETNSKFKSFWPRRVGGVKPNLEAVVSALAANMKWRRDGTISYEGDMQRDAEELVEITDASFSVTLKDEEEMANVESVLAVLRDAPSQRTDLENILVEMLYRARERRSSRIK